MALLSQDLKRDREIKREFFGIGVPKAVKKDMIPNSVHATISRLALKNMDNIEFKKNPLLKANQAEAFDALMSSMWKIKEESAAKLNIIA